MTEPDPSLPRSQPRRDHLIEVAYDLFNTHGFHQAGIDLIMRESGVSKTTLYKYFQSKEELILEVLSLRSARTLANMTRRLGELAPDAPVPARIDTVLDVIQEWIESQSFFGCNFIRAAAEYGLAGHPIKTRAAVHKQAVRALVAKELGAKELGEGDVQARDRVAAQIMLVIDGAISVAQVGYDPEPMTSARQLIRMLLEKQLA